MYLRKIRPSTTCLYSAASMLLRSLSAVAQSLASKPRLAVVSLLFVLVLAISFLWDSAQLGPSREFSRQNPPRRRKR